MNIDQSADTTPSRLEGWPARLVGLALTVIGIVTWHTNGNHYGVGFALWAMGLLGFALSFAGAMRRWERVGVGEMWALAIILVGAAALRLPRIYDIPANISVDELLPMLDSYRMAMGQAPNAFASIGWFSLPNLTFAPAALIIRTGLFEPFHALRIASALTGLCGIWFTFLLGRRLFSPRTAMVAAFLMAVGFWHLHNSRTGFPFPQSSSMPPLALYFLVSALQDRNERRLAIAGVVTALALEFYFPVRILLPILPFALVGMLRHLRYSADEALRALSIFAVPMLLALAPIVWFVGAKALAGHSQDILITRPGIFDEMTRRYGLYDWSSLLRRNVTESSRMFTQWADVAVLNRSPAGLFDPVTLVLVIAGLCFALLEGSAPALLVAMWAAITFIAGVALTDSPRASYRLAAALPALVLLGGFAVDSILRSMSAPPTRYGRTVRPLLVLALAVWIGGENYRLLFTDYTRGDGKDMPWSAAMRFLAEHCDGRHFYVLPGADPLLRSDAVPLFCPDYDSIETTVIPGGIERSRAVTFLLMGQQFAAINALKRCYPGHEIMTYRKPDSGVLFSSMDVPIADLIKADPTCAAPPTPAPRRQPA